MSYDFSSIEAHWQAYWDKHQCFAASIDPSKPKYYVLDMFPYPSGEGLHVGHPEGYTATDIMARYKRMKGFSVLHPMGWDAFGLPAERYAMKHGEHPAKRTAACVEIFKGQLKRLGFSYDWSREIDTTDPKYYRWTQWIFLQLWGAYFDREQGCARPIAELLIPEEIKAQGEQAVDRYVDERRLAYLKDAPVNWCPELRVVLANEEVSEHVEAGREVVRVPMKQWMLRITEYSERLLADLELLDWPSHVLGMQRNWIGRSEGASIRFAVQGHPETTIEVFSTRPDTLFGASYLVLAPEHPLALSLASDAQRQKVQAYKEQSARRTERDRQSAAATAEKTGVETGAFAIHPVSGAKIPIWVGDYVLMNYGTGAVMAVPGHDERDHAFAKQMGLPIIRVVEGGEADVQDEPFLGQGVATASGFLDGMPTKKALAAMIEWLEANDAGTRKVSYKLRDWLFSRQRYWGEPFPLIYDESGKVHGIPEEKLPVTLPEIDDFNPSEGGEAPLAKAKAWREEIQGYLRETNTMPQWAGSCWYFLRYCDPHNDEALISEQAERYWMPVDLYVGGAEHAVLHLLYARFWHKVLFDLGHVHCKEPFHKLVNQGMVLGATYFPEDRRRDDEGKKVVFAEAEVEALENDGGFRHKTSGEKVVVQWDKMSKSRGNVVNPDDVVSRYGADTLRLYEMFMGPLEASAPWQPEGVVGCYKFLSRVHRLYFGSEDSSVDWGSRSAGEGTDAQKRLLHQTLLDVSERIENMNFNTAISAMMVFVRDIEKGGSPMPQGTAKAFARVLAPFAPHLAESCWQALGHDESLTYATWPQGDPSVLESSGWTCVLMVNGKKRAEIQMPGEIGPKDKDAAQARVQADPAYAQHVGENPPKKVIFVPGKLVNVVL